MKKIILNTWYLYKKKSRNNNQRRTIFKSISKTSYWSFYLHIHFSFTQLELLE